MPRGVQPRIAPTMNYGIVGSTVYSDVIRGVNQLASTVTQGRRDIADAEFRSEGLDMRRDQNEFEQKQAGIQNARADAKFEEQKSSTDFDQSMAMIAAGMDPTGLGTISADQVKQAQQQSKEVQSINSLQALMSDSQATLPGSSGFTGKAMDQFIAQTAPTLNTDNREGFVLEHDTTPNGSRLITDKVTYAGLVKSDPEMAKWFSVKGAAPDSAEGQSVPVTRTEMSRLLGQQISMLPSGTPAQQRQKDAAWANYRNDPATSGAALVFETDKARDNLSTAARTGSKSAQARTASLIANDDKLNDNEKAEINRNLGDASQRLISEALTKSEAATSPQEVGKIERKLEAELTSLAARSVATAKDFKLDKKFAEKIVGWTGKWDGNTLNTKDSEWGGAGRHSEVVKASATAAKGMSAQIARKGRVKYLNKNGDSSEKQFNKKIIALETDLLRAMKSGDKINPDLYAFAVDYAPDVVTQLEDSGVPQFKKQKIAQKVDTTTLPDTV